MYMVCTSYPINTAQPHLATHDPVNLDHTAVSDLFASTMAAMASVPKFIVGVHQILPYKFTVLPLKKRPQGPLQDPVLEWLCRVSEKHTRGKCRRYCWE